MSLLLLLSALLTALSGAAAGVRSPEVPQAVSRSGASSAAAAVRTSIRRFWGAKPLPSVDAAVARVEGKPLLLRPAVPIFLGRRRE